MMIRFQQVKNYVYDPKGDILFLEKLLNEDPFQLPRMDLKLVEESKAKSFVEEPPELELKELPSHLEYAFLEESNKLPVIIAKGLKDVKKEALVNVLKSRKRAIAWKISDIKGIDLRFYTHVILMEDDYKPVVQCQRRVNPKIHDVIKKEVIKLLDAGYFQISIDPQDQEKTTFTCPYRTFVYRRMPFGLCNAPGTFQREVIVLGHKISKSGIEVDRAKVDVIAKLPHPTTVKGVRSFLGHAECIDAFNILKKKLTEASVLVVLDWNLPFELMYDASDYVIGAVLGQPVKYLLNKQDAKPRLLLWVLLLQEFDTTILDKKGSENLAADHLSRLENPHKDVLENKDINENFPLETLGSLSYDSTLWFTDIANFYARNFIKKGLTSQQKKKFFKDLLKSSKLAMRDLLGVIMVPISQRRRQGKISQRDEMPQNAIQVCEIFDVKVKMLPTNDARVVVKFLKSLFSQFGILRAIISDRGTHFCNDQFTRVMIKYGVTHRLATAYHPRMSGQVEVSNHGLKRILKRTVGENRVSWLDKLDDALWAFRTAYKTLIGYTPYKLVYGKSCHLLIELEHRAYWALKHVNFDLKTVGDHHKLQLNELSELRDQAYENYVIYIERTKKLHDSKIKNRIFNVGDKVLLFNSCLKIFSGKLKTRWFGPFTITQVFPYGTIEFSQPNGPNFKVNGHRVKHYFGGDIPSNVILNLHTFPMDK
nr:reverse transcriptase domain-containing protein [Tanacetum cinerariifolium]